MDRPFDLLTFDFDGVLLHNTYNDLFFEQCRALGLSWQAEREPTLVRFVHDYYGTGMVEQDMADYGRHAFWPVANRRFLEVLGVTEGIEELAHTLAAALHEGEVHFFYETGIHELLDSLRDRGYHLAMLTNRDDKVLEFGAAWGLIEPFDLIGTRDTVGQAKPSPALFHHISAHFQVPATHALHIGDNPYADVRGAQAAGWHCLLIDPDNIFPDWEVPRLPTIHDLAGWLAAQPRR